MRSTARACFSVLLLSVIAAAPHRGGSMVLTLEEVPEYLVVGEPFTFRFTGREHTKVVTGAAGLAIVNGQTLQAERSGAGYVATYVPDRVGEAQVQLAIPTPGPKYVVMRNGRPKHIELENQLLPIAIVAADAKPAAMAPQERGRHLFVAKGCIACHRHDALGDATISGGAPDLSRRTYPIDYLTKLVTNPDSVMPRLAGFYGSMPALGLSAAEIQSIAAFLAATANAQHD